MTHLNYQLSKNQTLTRWNNDQQSGKSSEQEGVVANVHGFGSISRRQSNKPIIAAVNGGAYGGGLEMVVNCDIVIATEGAKFAFPEVKRGVVAIQGGTYNLSMSCPANVFRRGKFMPFLFLDPYYRYSSGGEDSWTSSMFYCCILL